MTSRLELLQWVLQIHFSVRSVSWPWPWRRSWSTRRASRASSSRSLRTTAITRKSWRWSCRRRKEVQSSLILCHSYRDSETASQFFLKQIHFKKYVTAYFSFVVENLGWKTWKMAKSKAWSSTHEVLAQKMSWKTYKKCQGFGQA